MKKLIIILLVVLCGASTIYVLMRRGTVVTVSQTPALPPSTEIQDYNSPKQSLDIDDPMSIHILVNKKRPLSLSFRPDDLETIEVRTESTDSTDEKSVRSVIRPQLEQFIRDAETAGFVFTVNSGFRSSELQERYFNQYAAANGEEAANKFSARAGQSEHQTGLTVDINYTDGTCYLEACLGNTPGGQWLENNAHRYGFILRYPTNKESITGYIYEPWHFRYVGSDIATTIFNGRLTYEEYLSLEGIITL